MQKAIPVLQGTAVGCLCVGFLMLLNTIVGGDGVPYASELLGSNMLLSGLLLSSAFTAAAAAYVIAGPDVPAVGDDADAD